MKKEDRIFISILIAFIIDAFLIIRGIISKDFWVIVFSLIILAFIIYQFLER